MLELLHDVEQWETLSTESAGREIIIFKFSPTCPVSHSIERDFDQWLEKQSRDIICAKVDVIRGRALSQHLADQFGIRHESPQVLWLDVTGKVKWSGSHFQITPQTLQANLAVPNGPR